MPTIHEQIFCELWKEENIADGKQCVLGEDFNSFFDVALETAGGKAHLKPSTASKLLRFMICQILWFMWHFEKQEFHQKILQL